jgi:hypothetical protein
MHHEHFPFGVSPSEIESREEGEKTIEVDMRGSLGLNEA